MNLMLWSYSEEANFHRDLQTTITLNYIRGFSKEHTFAIRSLPAQKGLLVWQSSKEEFLQAISSIQYTHDIFIFIQTHPLRVYKKGIPSSKAQETITPKASSVDTWRNTVCFRPEHFHQIAPSTVVQPCKSRREWKWNACHKRKRVGFVWRKPNWRWQYVPNAKQHLRQTFACLSDICKTDRKHL